MNGGVDEAAARVGTAKAASDQAVAIISHAQRARSVMAGVALGALIVLASLSLVLQYQQNQRILHATGPSEQKAARQQLVNVYDCLVDQADLLAGKAPPFRVKACP